MILTAEALFHSYQRPTHKYAPSEKYCRYGKTTKSYTRFYKVTNINTSMMNVEYQLKY